MTTQHTPSFDQELARQLKATAAAQALADDYRRQIDKLRDALAAQGKHIPALHAHAERLEAERDRIETICLGLADQVSELRNAARAVCASRVGYTDAVDMVGRAALGKLERMVAL